MSDRHFTSPLDRRTTSIQLETCPTTHRNPDIIPPPPESYVNLVLNPSWVTESSTAWDKGENVNSAWWQVTLCDHIYGM